MGNTVANQGPDSAHAMLSGVHDKRSGHEANRRQTTPATAVQERCGSGLGKGLKAAPVAAGAPYEDLT